MIKGDGGCWCLASADIVTLGHFLYLSQIGSKLDDIGLNVDVDHLFIVFP